MPRYFYTLIHPHLEFNLCFATYRKTYAEIQAMVQLK